jgi:hypothetical protein
VASSGGICLGIPTINSHQGSHQVASTPWKSFGNRLFKRGNAFFIRVRIPRDLQDLYAATGRRSEICETLKTGDRREAERRCRRRGAEIDQEFARAGGSGTRRTGSLSGAVSTRSPRGSTGRRLPRRRPRSMTR